MDPFKSAGSDLFASNRLLKPDSTTDLAPASYTDGARYEPYSRVLRTSSRNRCYEFNYICVHPIGTRKRAELYKCVFLAGLV
jgi:hypothetical protein